MPEGLQANINADNVVAPFGFDSTEFSQGLAMFGAGLDVAEMLVAPFAPAFAMGIGVADAVATFGACYYAGECYINQPHRDLPVMGVINQDVALNTLDVLLVGLVPETPVGALSHPGFTVTSQQVVDVGTSYLSLIYDVFDVNGELIPNHVSFGLSFNDGTNSVGFYILVYR